MSNKTFDFSKIPTEKDDPVKQEQELRQFIKNNQRAITRNKNVNRLIRIHDATKDLVARRSLFQKIQRLIKRYEENPIQ